MLFGHTIASDHFCLYREDELDLFFGAEDVILLADKIVLLLGAKEYILLLLAINLASSSDLVNLTIKVRSF